MDLCLNHHCTLHDGIGRRATLQLASLQYGVLEEYILAIFAEESKFGGNVGNNRVLDAFTTLSFDYARRGDYFRNENEYFLIMMSPPR